MKRLTLIFNMILILNLGLKSQKYVQFPVENANWNVYLLATCDNNSPPDTILLRYTLHDDTTINEILYHKLYLESGDTINPRITSVGGLREKNKKIFYIGKDFLGQSYYNEELLLYDFSKQVDDTIQHDKYGDHYTVILEIDSIIIGKEYRKRYMVDNNWYYHNPDYIVEGIGSIQNGLLGHITQIPTCGYHYWENICYRENGNVLYLNPSFNDCYPDNLLAIANDNAIISNINIYPNPFKEKIHIDNLPNNIKLKIEILDCLGQEILIQQLKARDNMIQIPSINDFYIVLIMDNNSQIIKSEKIIKE